MTDTARPPPMSEIPPEVSASAALKMNSGGGGGGPDDVVAVAALIDELKSEDVRLRLNSISRLSTIAAALGPERTRNELVPFLVDMNDDDDECLMAVAEHIPSLVTSVGGDEFVHALLLPLESLSTVEETVVRQKAVEGLVKVGERCDRASAMEHFYPLVKRLATGEWFTARVSACGLFACALEKVSSNGNGGEEEKKMIAQLRSLFGQLCDDETPMVRRAAATNLGKVAEASVEDKQFINDEVLKWFGKLTADEQDSVRLLAVDDCVSLSKLVSEEERLKSIVPVALKFSSDTSWRVRYAVAQQIYELCEIIGADFAREDLFPAYENLLEDAEAEVRIAAAAKVSKFCALAGPERSRENIIPRVRELAKDASQHVRAALASVVMESAPTLGKEETVNQLLPIFLVLLKDEFPDVRLNVIGKLDQVNEVIGVDTLSKELLPAIKDLAEDRHWRVRLAIIEYIPILATQTGESSFLFSKEASTSDSENNSAEDVLNSLCLRWLADPVSSIRQAAGQNLQNLTALFGSAWAKEHVIPKLESLLQTEKNYLVRVTVASTLGMLAEKVDEGDITGTLFPIAKAAAADSVANVRFNIAKSLEKMAKSVSAGSAIRTEILEVLDGLKADADVDVQFYASEARNAF
jgi:serine/threonine-protein phosphatase 2A regulatory subunit A